MTTYGPFISRAQAKEQGLKRYYDGKVCKHGHNDARMCSNGQCVPCKQRIRSEQKTKRPDLVAAQKQRRVKKLRQTPKGLEQLREPSRRYAQQIKLTDQQKNRINHQRSVRYFSKKNDVQFRLTKALRGRFQRAVAAAYKTTSVIMLCGCSIAELRIYLELQFTDGMSWDNYGEWHIDHIRPCASFDLTDEAQQRECFHFSNLQPLWALDNIRKSDHWEPIAA